MQFFVGKLVYFLKGIQIQNHGATIPCSQLELGIVHEKEKKNWPANNEYIRLKNLYYRLDRKILT